jgi:NAD(P)-dependent dehydrogenase (short-subunit alcohol dehydrogenase family)
MGSFRDRVVLITGAASGIGRQMAIALAEEGARIAALDRQTKGLESLEAELKGKDASARVAIATADVTKLEEVRQAVARMEEQLGGATDLLIASAGIGRGTPAAIFPAEDINAQIEVNLIGVVNSIDAVLPGMRQRRCGHIAALSSLASYRGLPHMAGYSASKAGLNALLDSLRVELRPLGIAVTTLCPGWIRTPLTAPIGLPPGSMMEVEAAVRRMLSAIRARRAFLAFPFWNVWQCRLLRYLPRPLGDWLAHRFLLRAAKLKK